MYSKAKTRFVIFGQGRSGSNLLVDLLNSHPDIYCDAELFNKHRLARKSRLPRSLIYRYPDYYIKMHLKLGHTNYYGFKLMYHQLRRHEKIRLKLFNGNWKIIHIQRKDILAQTLSGIVASETGSYMRRKHHDKPFQGVLSLDPQTVLKEMKNRIAALKYETDVLEGIDHLNVIYENDLFDSRKWNKSCARIFEFLGLSTVEVSATIIKTDPRTNEERIANYPEILAYLKKSGFNYFSESAV